MAAAIALTAGFYLLALAIVAGLLAVAVLPWVHGEGRPALSITSLLIAGGIAFAIVPRRIRFEPRGRSSRPRTPLACTPCWPRRRGRPASACPTRST